ncbi:hypothetical protein [Kineococcus radiotolerans]|uniref:Tail terminator n=1 Tax=Kineococcus radiotolerans (strain ATCC BAA-149 / DSM 14245 / SRS30216) TaxID=266940 RepID=A6W8R2_KINRD|nr:hypothetical protein [Kineococcus radiotolerans]ABS03201.1 hypothetical protein Krad_1715 [Kineococcus radiotolerans SRS30216 = ATCC BAA-149]
MSYPDIDQALKHLLAPLVGGLEHIGTETPSELQQRLPYIRVGRIGGPRTALEDAPVVEIDYFTATRAGSVKGAGEVSDLLLGSPYHFIRMPDGASALLENPQQPVGPRELPWPATGVRRFSGTYRFVTRSS